MNNSSIPRVLTIAGTDPSGGAGAQADIKSITVSGGFALSVITAMVAQNTHGVKDIFLPPTDIINAQLDALSEDTDIDAVKIGMLAHTRYIEAVESWLQTTKISCVVIDPVMVATSGDRLLEPDAEAALIRMLPLATLITPNTRELEVIAGRELNSIQKYDDAVEASKQVAQTLNVHLVVKGGHLDEPVIHNAVIGPDGIVASASAPRITTSNTHGTGCSLSSSIATRLALGDNWQNALTWCTRWLNDSIANGSALKVGREGGHGPMDHSHHMRLLSAAGKTTPRFAQTLQIPALDSSSSAPRISAASSAPFLPANTPLKEIPAQITPAGEWTRMLWHLASPILQGIYELPFIKELGDGTLDEALFTFYQRQDYLYLGQYSRALATLAGRATSSSDTVHWAKGSVECIEVERTELHDKWFSSCLGTPYESILRTPPTPVTKGYTNFFLARTAVDEYAVGVAAVLPCYWLYYEIGNTLIARNYDGHPYSAWLSAYGNEDFREVVETAISIAEKEMAQATPELRRRITEAFLEAAQWEYDFFDQAHRTF